MKTPSQSRTKDPKNIDNIDGGRYGIQQHLQNVAVAKTKIPEAAKIEREKLDAGFKWLVKDKTSKLVHPDNIEKNLRDGWKLSK